MQRSFKSVLWWGLAGVVAAEITFLLLKLAVAPSPLNVVSAADLLVFRLRIIAVFLLTPLMMQIMARSLQDESILKRSRSIVLGLFLSIGLLVHLFVIRQIFGKPRPEILGPYEFSLDWFFFFTWSMGGMLIGLGLVSLYSLLFTKRAELSSTAIP